NDDDDDDDEEAVLLVESEHDDVVPHPAVASFRAAFGRARSLTYRVICRISQETGAHDSPCDKPLLRRAIAQEMRDLDIHRPTADEIIRAIYDSASSPSTVTRHAEIVRDAATLRLTKSELSGLYADADLFDGTAGEFIAHAQARILALSDAGLQGQKPVRVSELMPGFREKLHADYDSPTGLRGLDTGFPRLNQATRGLRPGHLIIVAAQSGEGKSTFAMNVGTNVARQQKHVLVFTLEMEQDELLERITFSEARIPKDRFARKELSHADWAKLDEKMDRVAEMSIRLYDDSSVSVARIATICRYARWCGECDLVIVDYTQLVTPDRGRGKSSENREREVAQIAEDLKRLGNELKVPVMALSQLNDAGQMRESRAIKQHANVLLILRCTDAQKGKEIDEMGWLSYDLEIDKNRDGKWTTIPMQFYPAFTRFYEEAPYDADNYSDDAYDHSASSVSSVSPAVPATPVPPEQYGIDGLDD
ncbi:MAG: DnaB-like helicase C-terminal domain-containing protein, partial [Armatimonadota bacterium]